MVTHAVDGVAGHPVPDTALARDITMHVREVEDDLLFHHSSRVYAFAAMHAGLRGQDPDLELLYAGAMFHDVGLTEPYRSTSSVRFEVDSARAAHDFLVDRGVDEVRARKVWLGIALHTTPGIAEFLDPEVALVTAGVETDVLGRGLASLPPVAVAAVVDRHPRPDFKRRILATFYDGMHLRPATTDGTPNADVLTHFDPAYTPENFAEVILGSGWPE